MYSYAKIHSSFLIWSIVAQYLLSDSLKQVEQVLAKKIIPLLDNKPERV